ncbi:MAG: pyridoxamine 5'-phosphate oxidase [Vicinamibacteria bacterium]|nr:pyridoxamine 5'-phosphate oxidase [Vicinamibacteria bacterium]
MTARIAPLDEPLIRFQEMFVRAQAEEANDATAVALATSTMHGRPSLRFVLLKGVDIRGFVFYTNYQSRKATELESNSQAAMTFYWPGMYVQIRVEGTVDRVSAEESDAYFESRPFGHRLGAWSSDQSREIDSAEDLSGKFAEVETRFQGHEVPRPAHWGGYRITPESIEFWFGKENRMHERELYTRAGNGWMVKLLQP